MKYRINLNLLLFLVVMSVTYGQVQKAKTIQIGNTTTNSISSSAALQIDEIDRGFLPPRLTTAQRDAISLPANGLTIFNTTTNCLEFYKERGWFNTCGLGFIDVSSGGSAIVSSYSCSTASSENMIAGTAVSNVTQKITANVATAGTYSIYTSTVNGITFSGSGTILGTGSQEIELTASGTPVYDGISEISFSLSTKTPNCTFTRTISPQINTPVTIPSNITLNQSSKYLVPSCYDNDYLPYVVPTVAATTVSVEAGGGTETLIDKQGSITTAGVFVNIPITITSGGTLPAYSTTITIPSTATEDGIGRDLTLSWDQQTFASDAKTITAKISAVGGSLNVKKLDINSGIGNDYLGVLIGRFIYPYNNSRMNTTFDVRVVSLIPDRMAGVQDKSGSTNSHMMFYAPVAAEDGSIWLNNNLGSDYSNMNKLSVFNPIQQAVSATDNKAYGSFFQWGRKPDGHELINWTLLTAVNSVVYSTPIDEPDHPNFIKNSISPSDWRINQDDNLWTSESSPNNPCPFGFRLPTVTELTNFQLISGIKNSDLAFKTSLKFVLSGNRASNNGNLLNINSAGYYWSSSVSGTNSKLMGLTSNGAIVGNTLNRAIGISVRCIKN
jgi:hypothetical protein